MSRSKCPPREMLLAHVAENLSDTDIGRIHGVGKMAVYNWRRKLSIPSRYEYKLQSLPALTDEQKQLILGGLLGDGQVRQTSSTKGDYCENHSLAQRAYLKWKEQILGPWVSRAEDFDTRRSMATVSHPYFFDLYQKWYPSEVKGRWTKQVPSDVNLTPLSLAVWFMDDGSRNNRTVRISFGLGHDSLVNALAALDRIGFHPTMQWDKRGSGNCVDLAIPDSETDLFLSMIDEYIHPSLRYKLPERETPRKSILINASRLTHDIAVTLVDKEFSVPEIALMFSVSEQTVSRRLGTTLLGNVGRPRGRLHSQAADLELGNLGWPLFETLTDVARDQKVQEAVSVLLQTDFPYPLKLNAFDCKKQIQKLSKAPTPKETPGYLGNHSPLGNHLYKGHMPHFYKVRKGNRPYSRSVFKAWGMQSQLEEAVRIVWKDANVITCKKVMQTLCFTHRSPTNFRPLTARLVYDRYCPMMGTVYDPCAGWGGRLLGFAASSTASKYIGSDVEPATIEGLEGLWEAVSHHLDTPKQIQLQRVKSQEWAPSEEVDLVFTSPPYFTAELYSNHPDQSCVEYSTYPEWVTGFLEPMVQKSAGCLIFGGNMLLCVADIKIGKEVYPVVEDTLKAMLKAGITTDFSKLLKYPLRGGRGRYETVLVGQKAT